MIASTNCRCTFVLPRDLRAMIDSIARVEMRTTSNICAMALSQYVKQYVKDETHRALVARVCGSAMKNGGW
jgi:predicted transcriptional regulator